MAIGAVGIAGIVVVATGNQKGDSTVWGFAGLGLLVALGVLGVIFFVPIWTGRRSRILVDHTGLWVENGKLRNVIPWNALAGVCLYWSKLGSSQTLYSLELFPTGPIDRDDPVLWTLVRDEEPFRPGLPRLRHRLAVPAASRQQMVAAVQRYAPRLWLGESERASGHIGRPDIKGHRERTRGEG
ncbi:hypothetical protein [Actinomadura sp. KC345]|uniref:hypothetical protein n=1 Tax=Actinomadura sp. KC345 TaxID=2530371 RepID=UPI001A9D7C16|nr:hypothetical protein [Actinomadura sp. KC345]